MILLQGCSNQIGSLIGPTQIINGGGVQNATPTPTATNSGPILPVGDHKQTNGYGGVTSEFQNCNDARVAWNKSGQHFCSQWHLFNFGQQVVRLPGTSVFNDAGASTIDLNLTDTLKEYRGEGITINVVDSGTYSHPDLDPQYLGGIDACANGSFTTQIVKPKPLPLGVGHTHGIRVSGIIVANGKVHGVADKAKYYINNHVSCMIDDDRDNPSSANIIASGFIHPVAHLKNMSWGNPACDPGFGFGNTELHQDMHNAIELGASTHNYIYVKSAGNDQDCSISTADTFNSSPYISVVAALDNEGVVASYSTAGPSLTFAGLAGYGSGYGTNEPGIATTTIASIASEVPSYDADMNGTSAAGPTVTGALALLKEAFNNFKWYEIVVLAIINSRSSNIGNGTDGSMTKSSPISGVPYINRSQNAMGYYYSWYTGFGLPNVDQSIAVGKSTFNRLPPLKRFSKEYNSQAWPTSEDSSLAIASGQCQEKTIQVNHPNFQIFTTLLAMDVTVGSIKNLIATLTSPSGTTVQVMRANGLPGSNLMFGQYHKINGLFAEQISGTWKLKLCATTIATLKKFKIDFYGFDGLDSIPANNL